MLGFKRIYLLGVFSNDAFEFGFFFDVFERFERDYGLGVSEISVVGVGNRGDGLPPVAEAWLASDSDFLEG
jgi:hypothetical protein